MTRPVACQDCNAIAGDEYEACRPARASMLTKIGAVELLGERGFSLPNLVRAALAANDRLKLYFSVLQTAVRHADHPEASPVDLSADRLAAGVRDTWLDEVPAAAERGGDAYFIPEIPRLRSAIVEDLGAMARPVLQAKPDAELDRRLRSWLEWCAALPDDRLTGDTIARIVHGQRQCGDSAQLPVIDLHRALNGVAARLAM